MIYCKKNKLEPRMDTKPENLDFSKIIYDIIYELLSKSSTSIPKDTQKKLNEFLMFEKENPIASAQLELMINNISYGHDNQIPLCQDTGTINFFVQMGTNFPYIHDLKPIFSKVLQALTSQYMLRPNAVDPISQQNSQNNTGENFPPIYLDLIEYSDDLVITVVNKGGGSENISTLFMLSAATGLDDFSEKILSHIQNAGGKPCPPIIVGLGIGGDSVKSMILAKKALLRPLGSHNHREEIAAIEKDLLKRINDLDIGVMGLGGHSNCLDVRIEWAMRHPASFPVGMVIQCYSHRTESCCIHADGSVEYGRLNDKFQFEKEEK